MGEGGLCAGPAEARLPDDNRFATADVSGQLKQFQSPRHPLRVSAYDVGLGILAKIVNVIIEIKVRLVAAADSGPEA